MYEFSIPYCYLLLEYKDMLYLSIAYLHLRLSSKSLNYYVSFRYRNRYLFVFVTVIGNETYRTAFFLLFRLAQKLGKGLVQFVELRIGAYLQFLDSL